MRGIMHIVNTIRDFPARNGVRCRPGAHRHRAEG